MSMQFFNPIEGKGRVPIGSGYLYATLASSFDVNDVDTDKMTEIGYIHTGVSFKRTHETKTIESANYGTLNTYNTKYDTTFETGIISYNAQNIAQFLTGDDYVAGTAANGKITNKTYFIESAKIPEVALVFVGKDEDTNEEMKLILPRCKWQGDYTLDFNNDNPIEINYSFKVLNTTLPNNKYGAGWKEFTEVVST